MKNYFRHEPSNKIWPSRVSMSKKSKCLRLSRRNHSRPLLINELTERRKAVFRPRLSDVVQDIKELMV